MSSKWEKLTESDSSNSELTDTLHTEALLKVVRVLQKAGFCIYPSENEVDNIMFIMPVSTESWFPQDSYSNN